MKYLLITNVPSPYRAKQYNLIGDLLKEDFLVIYTHSTFPTTTMKWNRPRLNHQYIFLDEFTNKKIRQLYSIFMIIKNKKPKIIITSGFNIYMSNGFFISKLFRIKHVVFTDSWLHCVNQLCKLHKIIRKLVIKRSDGFICVGKKGKDYLEYFGASPQKIFISRLADKIEYENKTNNNKEYDLIFSGQLIDRKQPIFFTEVAKEVAKRIKNLRILILGCGPLESIMLQKLEEYKINYHYEGFVSPEFIKDYYSQAKILLFPTVDDPWGMVANDALSVGVPVITTPYAGVADDLVIDGYNGFVLDLDVKKWTEKTLELLGNIQLYDEFSKNALSKIKEFSVEKAASDFVNALRSIECQ